MALNPGEVLADLQKVLEQCRDPGRKPRACSPTAMQEQMKERIRNISQDMYILNRSCGEELRRGAGAMLPDTGAEVRAQKRGAELNGRG